MITTILVPPTPADTTAEFNTKAFKLLTDIGVWAEEVNSTVTTVETSVDAAETSAINAGGSAAAAASSANLANQSATAANNAASAVVSLHGQVQTLADTAQIAAQTASNKADEAVAAVSGVNLPPISQADTGKTLRVNAGIWQLSHDVVFNLVTNNTTITSSYTGTTLRASGDITLTLGVVAAGFNVNISNVGNSIVTLNAGTTTVDGRGFIYVYPGEAFTLVISNGVAITVGRSKSVTLYYSVVSAYSLSLIKPITDAEVSALVMVLNCSSSNSNTYVSTPGATLAGHYMRVTETQVTSGQYPVNNDTEFAVNQKQHITMAITDLHGSTSMYLRGFGSGNAEEHVEYHFVKSSGVISELRVTRLNPATFNATVTLNRG